jgi:hypothetical protein
MRVLFPAGCRICDQLLTRARRVPPEKCEICGQTFARVTVHVGEPPVGHACGRERPRSYGIYGVPLGQWFAERLAELANRRGSALGGDVAVTVPSH